MIPLIRTLLNSQPSLSRCQLHLKHIHPVIYLINQVIKRLLQSAQPDVNAVLLTLNSLPVSQAMEVLNMEWRVNQPQPDSSLRIAMIGEVFGRMKGDLVIINTFSERMKKDSWRCRLQELTGDSILSESSVRQVISTLLQQKVDLMSIFELCELVSLTPSNTAALLLTHAFSTTFDSLYQLLSPSDLHTALLEAISLTNGCDHNSLKQLYEALLQYGEEKEKSEAQRALSVLGIIRDRKLTSVNIHTLLSTPWTELSKFLCLYNYLSFLLLFSYLDINMESVVLFVMKQLIHDNTITNWSVIQHMIEDNLVVQHPCDIIPLCLEFSRMYQHPPSQHCLTIPCAQCMDAIAAAQKASDLSLEAMNSAYNKDRSNQDEVTEDWEVDVRSALARSCRIQLFSTIATYQLNRLRLGRPSIPSGILPTDPLTDCQNRFSDLSEYLEELYVKCLLEEGPILQDSYTRLVKNRSHLYSLLHPATEESRPTHQQKREASSTVIRNCRHQSYEVTETLSDRRTSDDSVEKAICQWESIMGSSEEVTFLFAPEAPGGLFVHSVFYILSKACSVSYFSLLENVRERLLQMKPIEEERVVWALVYLFEGLIDVDLNLFRHTATQLLQSVSSLTSTFYSYLQKSLLLRALFIVLSHFPSSDYQRFIQQCTSREASLFNLHSIQQSALAMHIRHGCQIYGIPVGNDVLVEVRNPSFLLNILHTHHSSREVLRWCAGFMRELKVEDRVVWESFLDQCQVIQDDELGAQCVLEYGVLNTYVTELLSRLLKEETLQNLGLLIMKKYRQELHNQIPSWIEPVLHSPGNLTVESMQCLCDLLLDQSEPFCRDGLEILIEKGASRIVLESITRNGQVSTKFGTVFGSAIKAEMMKDQMEWLFFSDYYQSVIEYCLQDEEKEWIHRWIEFHITSRRISEASQLMERSGWDRSIKEYVENVLRKGRNAHDLLCYLG